jgi:hypothetical protein
VRTDNSYACDRRSVRKVLHRRELNGCEAKFSFRVCASSHGGHVTYLLHDAGLPLAECDMSTRLVLDELDLNLSSFTAGLVIVVVVIVCGRRTRTLGATAFTKSTVAVADRVVVTRRVSWVVIGDFGGHGEGVRRKQLL